MSTVLCYQFAIEFSEAVCQFSFSIGTKSLFIAEEQVKPVNDQKFDNIEEKRQYKVFVNICFNIFPYFKIILTVNICFAFTNLLLTVLSSMASQIDKFVNRVNLNRPNQYGRWTVQLAAYTLVEDDSLLQIDFQTKHLSGLYKTRTY